MKTYFLALFLPLLCFNAMAESFRWSYTVASGQEGYIGVGQMAWGYEFQTMNDGAGGSAWALKINKTSTDFVSRIIWLDRFGKLIHSTEVPGDVSIALLRLTQKDLSMWVHNRGSGATFVRRLTRVKKQVKELDSPVQGSAAFQSRKSGDDSRGFFTVTRPSGEGSFEIRRYGY